MDPSTDNMERSGGRTSVSVRPPLSHRSDASTSRCRTSLSTTTNENSGIVLMRFSGRSSETLAKSSLYIGNLAFSTRSRQIRAHFSGDSRAPDRLKDTLRLCFVSTLSARMRWRRSCLSSTKLDGKDHCVELDASCWRDRCVMTDGLE
jgi:hypothetical protein